jgi:hypothetical protein
MSMELKFNAPVADSCSEDTGNPESRDSGGCANDVSRRALLSRTAFFGFAMAAVARQARAQTPGSGSFSDAAIALPADTDAADTGEQLTRAVKIARAMRSGPYEITKDATVAEMDHHGNMTEVLRQGANGWVCTPGNENTIGDPPMCVDELGMQWFKDAFSGQPRPTIKAPGLCYMLCGATQHSNTNPRDRTSPAIPIGPHWMILWPFDPMHCGLPTTVRDAGAWVMFAGTPYAYLHICGTPWAGNEYAEGDEAIWTMQYAKRAGR